MRIRINTFYSINTCEILDNNTTILNNGLNDLVCLISVDILYGWSFNRAHLGKNLEYTGVWSVLKWVERSGKFQGGAEMLQHWQLTTHYQ